MAESSSCVVVLAGPNGAGKTTAAPFLLRDAMAIDEFVNADAIAQGLSGFRPRSVDFTAGRIMLTQLRDLAKQNRSFAFETTLASRIFAPWINQLRERGYVAELHFLWLAHPDLAIARVAERVSRGGHVVDDETVARRYVRGLRNLFTLCLPVVDRWYVYDNSANQPTVVAYRDTDDEVVIDAKKWRIIQSGGAMQ